MNKMNLLLDILLKNAEDDYKEKRRLNKLDETGSPSEKYTKDRFSLDRALDKLCREIDNIQLPTEKTEPDPEKKEASNE